MEESLATLLRTHRPPQPDATLAARIIAQATPQQQSAPRTNLWTALAELLRPVPVAAFACSLLLGLLAGQQLHTIDTPLPQTTVPKLSQNAGIFLYYNGEVL